MPKKVKCCECKYIQRINPKKAPTTLLSTLQRVIKSSLWTKNIYQCKADITYIFNEEEIEQFRKCSFFKSRTETAWQEIWRKQLSKILDPRNWIDFLVKFLTKKW